MSKSRRKSQIQAVCRSMGEKYGIEQSAAYGVWQRLKRFNAQNPNGLAPSMERLVKSDLNDGVVTLESEGGRTTKARVFQTDAAFARQIDRLGLPADLNFAAEAFLRVSEGLNIGGGVVSLTGVPGGRGSAEPERFLLALDRMRRLTDVISFREYWALHAYFVEGLSLGLIGGKLVRKDLSHERSLVLIAQTIIVEALDRIAQGLLTKARG